jgi:hypothetical protein
MKPNLQTSRLLVFTLLVLATGDLGAAPLGTAFSYQGQLQPSGGSANGLYDFQFSLWDAVTNGNLVGATQAVAGLTVSNGLFDVQLDFGPGPFTGSACWLGVGVRTNGSGAFTAMSPRQPLLPMPYAIMAGTASNLLGTLSAAQLSGPLPAGALAGYAGVVTFTNPANRFVGAFTGDGGGLTNLTGGGIQPGTISNATLVWGTNSIGTTTAPMPPALDPSGSLYLSYVVSGATGSNAAANGLYVWSASDEVNYVVVETNTADGAVLTLNALANAPYNLTISNGVNCLFYDTAPGGPAWPVPDTITNGAGASALLAAATNYTVTGIQVTGPVSMPGLTLSQASFTSAGVVNSNAVSVLSVVPYAQASLFPISPRGYSSYDTFSGGGEAFLSNVVSAMVADGWVAAGYNTIMVDAGWCTNRDSNGNLMARPDLYPHGMSNTIANAHAHGINFGVWVQDGSATWKGQTPPEPFNDYVQDLATLTSWGVDHLKWEFEDNTHLVYGSYYISSLLATNSRPMFLECGSDGYMPWCPAVVNSFRFTQVGGGDIDDYTTFCAWLDLAMQHPTCVGSGHWMNLDIFNMGNGSPTTNQLVSWLTFYAMTQSPLMFSLGNVPGTQVGDGSYNAYLTNATFLAIHDDPANVCCSLVQSNNLTFLYCKPVGGLASLTKAVVLMNRNTFATNLTVSWRNIGLANGSYGVLDIWNGTNCVSPGGFSTLVGAQAVSFLEVYGNGVTTNVVCGSRTLCITNGIIEGVQ